MTWLRIGTSFLGGATIKRRSRLENGLDTCVNILIFNQSKQYDLD